MTAVRHRLALRLVLTLALALTIAGILYGWSVDRVKLRSALAAPAAPARLSGPLAPPLCGDIDDPTPLRHVLPLVHMDPMPLGEAVEFLRELSGQNIFVNWRQLVQIHPRLEPDLVVPIELRVKDVTLGQVIAKLLACCDAAIGKDGVAAELGFGMRDGIITIGTDFDEAPDVVGRWYYVEDLVGVRKPSNGEIGRTRQESIDEVIRIVTETVAPDSWRDAGGSIGSIRELGDRLVVQQTPENHKSIEALLAALRKGR